VQRGQLFRRGRFKTLVLTLTTCGILLVKGIAVSYAWVNIISPNSDSTLSGTVAIKASVTDDYWSQLVVDGVAVASGSTGNVQFNWNTKTVKDGAHWITIKGYPSGQPANSSDVIAVSVLNNVAADRSTYFTTHPASWPLPSGNWCAQVIPWEPENVPTNQPNNNTKPTSSQLASYAANGYTANVYDGKWAYARANGQYTGTTDMMMRWAACKWGIDEDVVRAQAVSEHWNWDQNRPGDKRTSYAECVNDGFTSLWDFECSNCCWQTWSIYQTKVYYDWQTWPMILQSTAFAADYRYADQRACMNGELAPYFDNLPSYNGHSYSADIASGNLNTILWGCVGAHYSGAWYDGNSTGGALWYINLVQHALAVKQWKLTWPNMAWPN
jgi:Bacterial Ig domain